MARIVGLVMAGGLLLGAASESKAQFAMPFGSPYYGGAYMGRGYGYGLGGSGFAYRSGYAGVAPYGYGVPAYGGIYRGGYGYGVARPVYGGYGVRRGFGWGGRRWRRW